MKRRLSFIVIFLILILSLSIPSVYSQQCKSMPPDIPEDLKKFSIINDEVSKPYGFDDIGCAIKWRATQCISIQMTFDGAAKAHDFLTGEPIPVKDAFYVMGADIKTPQASGIVAFKTRKEAEEFLKKNGKKGKILTFDELINKVIE